MKDKVEISRKIIVIGASAGGLTPLTQFIKNLKLDNSTTAIVAVHMSPSHSSFLSEILAKSTKFPVTQVQSNDKLKTRHIYVAPPERHLIVEDFQFRLLKDDTSPQPNINILFESVAILDSVIPMGVILSGNGSDGTKGLLSIKTQGGLTFVQDPNTADYDSMPNSAIESDAADFVLNADEIGSAISLIIKKNQFPDINNLPLSEQTNKGIAAILDYLYHERQIDLHNYKSTSLRRRIYRRVALGGFTNVAEYLEQIKTNPNELESLINDIFISVTQFMRDPKVWTVLREVVVNYIKQKSHKLLRVWTVGCSTGEEAYSWAILLEEVKANFNIEFDYLIFATDISEKSIALARRGIYDISAIDNLKSSIIDSYFSQNQYGYQVERFIRDKIVFSLHNILLDPPFSNMDFLSCRNVLIYFNQKLQKRALANFGYSLCKQGFLILGSSESVGQKQKYFIDHDKDNKVFLRTNVEASQQVPAHSVRRPQIPKPKMKAKQKQDGLLQKIVQEKIAQYSGYSALLIDEKDDILFTYGNADPLLNLKPGRFSQCIFDYLDNNHRASLRALILKCRRTQNSVKHFEKFKDIGLVLYAVLPVAEPENWLVIILRQVVDADLDGGSQIEPINLSDPKIVHELEAELNSTRMSLQTVVEELEQTNDALQSSNEELQSSNEELQATNEELQTTNEELQSSNEELRTLNEELGLKNSELDLVSTHLQSVEENLETPYILLSKNLRVIRFSKTIDLISKTDYLELNDALNDIPWLNPDPSLRSKLMETANNVLEDRTPRTLVGFKINIRRYDIVIKHYSDVQKRFSEIMLVFTDVTKRFRQAEQALGDFKKREQILNLLETGVFFTDVNGIVKYINPQGVRYLAADRRESIGEHIDRLFYVYLNAEEKHPEVGLFQKMTDSTFGHYSLQNQNFVVKNSSEMSTIRLNVSPSVNNEVVAGWLFEIQDISVERELVNQIVKNATHDALTGLPNRRVLEEQITELSEKATRESSITYALVDIDHFKPINDIAGHVSGDNVLQLIAKTILHCVENLGLVARIGGDEFALLLVDVPLKKSSQILKCIIKAIDALELETSEGIFNVSASIGWCYLDATHGISISDLYSHADEAIYLAKRAGGNTLREFNLSDVNQLKSISAVTYEKIKFAFKHDFVEFAFQPIIDVRNANVMYFELLARIKDGSELMSPAEFMPVVERYNFSRQFDSYVFRRALLIISEIQKKTTAELSFAINLSASAIENRDIFDTLADFPKIIGSSNIKITLEITETAAIRDLFQASRFVQRAQRLGLKVALDDFGVGFNGFHYLKELKVDTVKVDGVFINGILDNKVDKIFVESVVALGEVLDFEIVAEYVDTPEKFELIKQMGFQFSQGFLHSIPLDLTAFYKYLND